MKSINFLFNLKLIFIVLSVFIVGCEKKYLVIDEFKTLRKEVINLGQSEKADGIYFLNGSVGYVGSVSGNLLKTSNGGSTWTIINSDFNSFERIYFINSNVGFVISEAELYKSSDGGSTFSMVLTGTYYDITDMGFVNDQIGYACGSSGRGRVYYTLNGGDSWNTTYENYDLYYGPITPNKFDGFEKIFVVDSSTIYCMAKSQVVYSTDAAANWKFNYDGSFSETLNDIYISGNSKVWMAGNDGVLTDFTDGHKYDIYAIDFIGSKGVAVGEKVVYTYEDGDWYYYLNSEGTSFDETFIDVTFRNSNEIFAITSTGNLMKLIY